ncbi:MAG: DUF354 domain-containing protein [Candidatus Electrothrix sp. AX1]|nr:DUF354 domain-containing protein [Candidatus Electrothrix sp. AX1]
MFNLISLLLAMNIFFNISHPAHVHFFRHTISKLEENGHKVIVGARKKEFTIKLLKAYNIDHIVLTDKGQGLTGLIRELLLQQLKLSKIIREHSIDMMLQISGIFNAPVGKWYGIPTLAFSDTENDTWGNKLSFSLSKHAVFPTCFDHSAGGHWKNQILYPGYHELAYLSPRYLTEVEKEDKFLVRFVGWGAGHDIGENGLTSTQKIKIVNILKQWGQVYISSEAELPESIAQHACTFHPAKMHNFMKTCKMVVGESATMASEAAVLGIPAVFISDTGRGYTTEQDKKYGLIKHYQRQQWPEIIATLKEWASQDLTIQWQEKRQKMLRDKIEVTDWLVDLVEQYPDSIRSVQNGDFVRYPLIVPCHAVKNLQAHKTR